MRKEACHAKAWEVGNCCCWYFPLRSWVWKPLDWSEAKNLLLASKRKDERTDESHETHGFWENFLLDCCKSIASVGETRRTAEDIKEGHLTLAPLVRFGSSIASGGCHVSQASAGPYSSNTPQHCFDTWPISGLVHRNRQHSSIKQFSWEAGISK